MSQPRAGSTASEASASRPAVRPAPPPVGRLAPSPTGKLHLGHARSFLLAWWSIRSRGGLLRLRMEDLDPERVKPGDAEGILRDLEWLGLDWDGEPMWQSQRGDSYRDALEQLARADLIYPCVCTRSEIAAACEAPHAAPPGPSPASRSSSPTARAASPAAPESSEPSGVSSPASPAEGDRYPGTCRDRFATLEEARARSGREAAWRFRAHRHAGPVAFVDMLHGPRANDVDAEIGDFPLTRKDGIASYQLAVIVDDAAQGVSEVLRGDDLLSSTARQALLIEALGLPRPVWLHVPLVTDESGRRLAKRSDDLSLAELRERGVDPRRIVSWAARSAGFECEELAAPESLLAEYSLESLSREAVPVAADAFAH